MTSSLPPSTPEPAEPSSVADAGTPDRVASDPAQAVAPAGQAVTTVFRRALRDVLILLAALTVLGVAIGAIISGLPGVWGALLGVGVALIFSATTVWTMLRTAHSSPTTMAAVIMGAWLGKMVVLIAVLVVLRQADFYDRYVFAVVLLVGAIGSAIVDYRAVSRGRVPYVDPGAGQPSR